MAIITPERYSHDTLRADLAKIDTVIRLLDLEIKIDDHPTRKLYGDLVKIMEKFEADFEEHDIEMQFVEKLVNEHKEMLRKEKMNDEKWELVLKVRNVLLVISASIGLYFTLKVGF